LEEVVTAFDRPVNTLQTYLISSYSATYSKQQNSTSRFFVSI